jgi:hypothetical protein
MMNLLRSHADLLSLARQSFFALQAAVLKSPSAR